MKIKHKDLTIETNPENDEQLKHVFGRVTVVDFFHQYMLIIEMLENPSLADLPLLQCLKNQYLGFHIFEGATLLDNNYMSYPGDPDLPPIVKFTRGKEVLFMYQSDFAALKTEDDEVYFTRLD